jgi:hypothetical protein
MNQGSRLFHYENEKCLLPVEQLVFINLPHLLKGFLNLAVAHKIMEVNE